MKKKMPTKSKVTKKVIAKSPIVKPADVSSQLTDLAEKVSKLESLLRTQSESAPESPPEEFSISLSELFRFFDVVDNVRQAYLGKYIFKAYNERSELFNGSIKVPTKPPSEFGKSFKRSKLNQEEISKITQANLVTQEVEKVENLIQEEVKQERDIVKESEAISDAKKVEFLKEIAKLLNASNEKKE